MSDTRKRKGQLVARALAGSWRHQPPGLDLTNAELDEVTPLLYGSGAAGLGWKKVKSSKLDSPSAAVLHQAHRLLSLQSALDEQMIAKVFRLLNASSVDAIVVKGWAAARSYPESALRPYGDIDLLVLDYERATKVLQSPELNDCVVDLHKRFVEIDERINEELFARSIKFTLAGEEIRVLSAEDQLALIAIHLLKHGAWRPLWLCDVAAAVEHRSPQFAWDICLGKNQKRARWITAAIGLANQLLQAEIASIPIASQAVHIPKWLSDSVLQQWATPFPTKQPPISYTAPLADYLRRPVGLLGAIRERWPNPILATVSVNGDFNVLPRLPYQVGNCALRAGQFLLQLPERLKRAH
jgi:hypothetical protein